MKKILLVLNLILISFNFYAQTSGSLDATFGTNGKVVTTLTVNSDRANAVAVQKDGKILLCGESSNFTTQVIPSSELVRYNANGTLDNTFGTNGRVSTKSDTAGFYGFAVAIQSDNKIIVAGLTNQSLCVIRYNTNGTLDNSFDGDGIAILKIQGEVSGANAVVIQSDGKILVAGTKGLFNNTSSKAILARFNTNGSLDNTFNSVGFSVNTLNSNAIDGAYDITIQADGKILTCGYSVLFEATGYNYKSFVLRYNTNGSLDNTFGVNGVAIQPNSRATAIKILSNGKILKGGIIYDGVSFNSPSSNGIFRYNSNGVLDNTFGTNGIVKSNSGSGAYDMILQSDSKIVLLSAENTTPIQANRDLVLARFNANGILDTTFATKGISITKTVLGTSDPRMTLQPDGKILVCGEVKNNTKSNFTVLRYNNNIGTSVKSLENKKDILVFPNPCKNDISFTFQNLEIDRLTVKVMDAFGNIVVIENYGKSYPQQISTINLERLPSGLYFIHLESDKIYQTQPIIKR